MEAIAAAAGVSKALPYRHFANSEEALVALFRREIGRLVIRLARAAEGHDDPDRALRAVVHEYFEAVVERGAVLGLLAGTGSDIPDLGGAEAREAPPFMVDLLVKRFGIKKGSATVLASMLVGAVVAASNSMGRQPAGRRSAEAIATSAVLGAVHAVAAGR
jgi:AcrR family transcriptional regulator